MAESKSRRIIKNTGFLYIRTVVSLLVSVFTTRILLEALGTADYGLYNVVGGSIAMLGFISASMSGTTQRFISYAEGSNNHEQVKSIFNNALLIHNLLALLSVIILVIAGLFFFNGVLTIPEDKQFSALAVYGCLLVSTAFSITVVPYEAEINAHEDMLFFSIIGIADVIMKFIIAACVLYVNGERLIIYAVLMALESTFVRFMSQWYCRKHYKECNKTAIRQHYNRDIIKEMLSFTGWNTLQTASGMIGLFGMNLVINHFFGIKLNAAMGIAVQLSGVLMGLSMNMVKALTPVLVKAEGGNNRNEMLRISIAGCKFSYLIFSFFGIPILIYLSPVLKLWLKNVPDMTTVFCAILIVTQLLEQLTVVLFQSISAEGHIKKYSIYRSLSNFAPLLISIIMFSFMKLQPYWILLNWLIFKGLISGLINIYFAKINIKMSLRAYLQQAATPCILITIASVFALIVLRYLFDKVNVYFLIPFILSAIISIPLYYYIALNQQERAMVSSKLMHIKTKIKTKCQ